VRRFTAIITAVVLGAVVPVTVSGASPPSGDLSFTDYGRGTVGEGINLDFPAGTAVSSSTYTVAPGTGTGWRTHPGPVTLVVTQGGLALVDAEDCSTKTYSVGQAAVVAAGQYLVANRGNGPLTFIGVFSGLPADAPKPLVTGDPEPTPAACGAVAGVSPAPPSVADLGDGRFINAETTTGTRPPASTPWSKRARTSS
jgi:quercetin dioxygenase-like cupin family protein